jgi:uncharacterized protein
MTKLLREGKQGRVIVARLENGKEVISEIVKICEEKNIRAGSLSVIGGLSDVELISMDSIYPKLINQNLVHPGPFEIQGTGTIALHNDAIVPHIHVTLGKFGNESLTGHLVKGKIALFIELVVTEILDVNMIRKEELDLFNFALLNFED